MRTEHVLAFRARKKKRRRDREVLRKYYSTILLTQVLNRPQLDLYLLVTETVFAN